MKRGDLIQAIEAMHNAARHVIACWEGGDLADAVRSLQAVDEAYAVPAIEWWESDE